MTKLCNWKTIRLGVVSAVCAAMVFVAGGVRAETPAELISNGSFENGLTGWTNNGTVYNYSYSAGSTWISPSLAKLDGVGSKCAMMSWSGSKGTSSIKQTVALGQSGLCLFSCAVAARSVSDGGTFYGATTAVTLDGADEYSLPITNVVTTVHHQHYMERVNAMASVPDATKVDTLKFATPLTSDRANIVDLVSLKLILPFQAGSCAVGGCQDGENFAYETLQPSVGTVLATNALVALSRTTSAKCLGYRIYRYTAANGYAPAEPEMVAATSHTVTAEDLQSPFRLEWVWQQVNRPIALDTTLFSRKCELTLSGYAGSETLTHFPLLVRLSADSPKGFAYGNAAVGGADLRFTDAEGNVIPHEIDTWNTSGESTVWVRVPAVTGSATKVYLYYGVADADMKSLPQNVAADVWCEHLGVWHMNVDAVNRITLDSSGSGMTGTVSNVASCDPAAMGVIGGVFTNTSNAGVNFTLSTDVRFLYAPIAFSCWAYDYNCGNFAAIWSGSNWGTFEIIFDGGKTKLLTRPCSSAHVVQTFYRTLRHVQVVYADGKSYVYMDGELAATKDCSVPGFSGLTSIYMACRGSSCNWLGTLDEMRIRTEHLTADWIKADYDSQKPNANFVTLGDVEVIKKATLSIADRGYTVDGTTLTMNAYVVPEPGKDAVCRVVYGADGTMSEATQQKTVTAESDCTETITLHMAPGDPARMPSVDSRQVWSEYLGVWHMDVASDWSVKESAASGLDASVKNGYPTACDPTVDPDDPSAYSFTGGAGIVGGSHTNSGWAYVRVSANAAFATLTSNVTFSAWVRSAANQSANPVMWNNMGGGSSFTTPYGTEIYVADAAGTRVGARGSGGTSTNRPLPESPRRPGTTFPSLSEERPSPSTRTTRPAPVRARSRRSSSRQATPWRSASASVTGTRQRVIQTQSATGSATSTRCASAGRRSRRTGPRPATTR